MDSLSFDSFLTKREGKINYFQLNKKYDFYFNNH